MSNVNVNDDVMSSSGGISDLQLQFEVSGDHLVFLKTTYLGK